MGIITHVEKHFGPAGWTNIVDVNCYFMICAYKMTALHFDLLAGIPDWVGTVSEIVFGTQRKIL